MAASLVAAGPAGADASISFPTGGAPSQYDPNEVTITTGESVTWTGGFSNHPLASTAFSTQNGGTSFTWQFNAAGDYPFHCTIHASMFGTVHVTAPSGAGGGGGGGGSPAPAPAPSPQPGAPTTPTTPGQPTSPTTPGGGESPDKTAPTAALSSISARAAIEKGVLVRFRSSEAGSASATLTSHKKTIGKAKTTYTTAGNHSLRVKLTKSGRSLLRRSKSLSATLRLVVSDASGNSARATRAIKLKP